MNLRNVECWCGPLLAVLLMIGTPCARAQDTAVKTFATYRAAARAFISAVKTKDDAALKEILGTEEQDLLTSGDDSQDENARLSFLKHYRKAHSFVHDTPDRVTLTVGATAWPLPFPIVRVDGVWHFDAAEGAQELVYRRIGHNELDALRVCHALYAAQKSYAATAHDGIAAGSYAQHFRSKAGTQNGLYWEVTEGQAESPAGSLVAEAASEGDADARQSGKRTPFHGYFYRILKAQGSHAIGGEQDYVKDGHMTGGFAIVAYPAEYKASGVMTFLVGPHGEVYQKDLGAATDEVIKGLAAFDPDGSWKSVR